MAILYDAIAQLNREHKRCFVAIEQHSIRKLSDGYEIDVLVYDQIYNLMKLLRLIMREYEGSLKLTAARPLNFGAPEEIGYSSTFAGSFATEVAGAVTAFAGQDGRVRGFEQPNAGYRPRSLAIEDEMEAMGQGEDEFAPIKDVHSGVNWAQLMKDAQENATPGVSDYRVFSTQKSETFASMFQL